MPRSDAHFETGQWVLNNTLNQLELLLRAIIYPLAEPILIIDDDRVCRDASCGARKLLGLPRDQIIGRSLDDFVESSFRSEIERLWKEILQDGVALAIFRLQAADGAVRGVEVTTKTDVLPGRHVLSLRDKSANSQPGSVQDYAVYVFDADGRIRSWHAGAERIYGYQAREAVDQAVSVFLVPARDSLDADLREELDRAAFQGHFGIERWHMKKDGSRFWANVLTMALRSENGEVEGFARVVRDFSSRRTVEEKLRPVGVATAGGTQWEPIVAGVVSGEFDLIKEANDTFLQTVGYTREDLASGCLYWPDLTPAEYSRRDQLAHEEALRYGACSPFEKEYVRKDGTRVGVLVTYAVLNLSPFHWIAIIHIPAGSQGAGTVVANESDGDSFGEIIGRSAAMKRVFKLAETVAPTDATVLIFGETGSGKELIARAVHRLSHRRNFPFVSLNCAAIPTGLLESELFGYERGAFTGALTTKIGRFEIAHRGTLFLDEVGDIPLDLQPKLLRALQEKSFERLGGTKTIGIDVRLVAATNRDLTQMMGDKLFRSDLYYRLKVFPITAPPLRDRPEDIPSLAHHFTRKYSLEMGKRVETIPSEIMRALVSWPWPGNVRELENFIERSVILSPGSVLNAPLGELRTDHARTSGTLAQIEREYVLRVLQECNGVISSAAIRLGLPRTTLNALMQKLGISRKDI